MMIFSPHLGDRLLGELEPFSGNDKGGTALLADPVDVRSEAGWEEVPAIALARDPCDDDWFEIWLCE